MDFRINKEYSMCWGSTSLSKSLPNSRYYGQLQVYKAFNKQLQTFAEACLPCLWTGEKTNYPKEQK